MCRTTMIVIWFMKYINVNTVTQLLIDHYEIRTKALLQFYQVMAVAVLTYRSGS
jgi:hypothetical protein